MIFLKWYSEQTAEPLGAIYRKVTLEYFQKWKIEILINAYIDGKIGVKQMAKIGGMTILECMKILEEKEIEPPENEIFIKHAEKIVEEEIIKIKEKK